MTNMEYYREQIEAITNNGDNIALDRHCGELRPCGSTQCNNCIFYEGRHCRVDILRWLMAEHKEEPTLTPDEAALLRLIKDGYITRDADGKLFWMERKPHKSQNCGFWKVVTGELDQLNLYFNDLLEFIRWGDEEPWSVEDLRKLKVKEEIKEGSDGRKEV